MPSGVYKRTKKFGGWVAWNKGIKGYQKFSKETRKKMSRNNARVWLGKKFTQDVRRKMSESRKGKYTGKNSPFWIKDRTKLKKSERRDRDVQYIYWRKEIKNRDEWKCRLSSDVCKGQLEAHHIFNWTDYPELRYVLTNGITLCHSHHPRKWEEEKRMIPIFQELLSVSKE